MFKKKKKKFIFAFFIASKSEYYTFVKIRILIKINIWLIFTKWEVEGKEVKFTKFKEFVSTKSLKTGNRNHKALCEIPKAQRKLNFLISDFCCDM